MLTWLFIVIVHWHNRPRIHMLLHLDTFSLFGDTTNLSCKSYQMFLADQMQLIPILKSLVWCYQGLEPTIFSIRDDHNNHFMVATMTWWTFMEYLCHKWPRIRFTCRKHLIPGSFLHSWLITGFLTRLTRRPRRVPLVEQELPILREHPSLSPAFSGVHVTRSLVLCVCFVYRCLFFSFWSLCCLFDIQILITPSVSSNSSYIIDASRTLIKSNSNTTSFIGYINLIQW
jgi:hypothetical protein